MSEGMSEAISVLTALLRFPAEIQWVARGRQTLPRRS